MWISESIIYLGVMEIKNNSLVGTLKREEGYLKIRVTKKLILLLQHVQDGSKVAIYSKYI